jgi:hypothetical protein
LRFYKSLGAGFAAITFIAFTIFAVLLSFILAVFTCHCELAFFLAMAHNVSAENQREQSRLVFKRGSGVISTWAFNHF